MSTRRGTVRITYRGGPMAVRQLVSMLEHEGVEVKWTPPEEQRDLYSAAESIVTQLVAAGLIAAIQAAVRRFLQRHPRAQVDVHVEDEDDD